MNYKYKLCIRVIFFVLFFIPFQLIFASSTSANLDSCDIWLRAAEEQLSVNKVLSEKYALKALEAGKQKDKQTAIAVSSFLLGKIYQEQGNLVTSNQYMEEARNLFKQLKDNENFANTLLFLGINSERLGLFNKALLLYIEAFDNYNQQNNITGKFAACNNIGSIYYQMADNEKALSFYKLALKLTGNEIPDTFKYKDLLANIGAIYFDSWKYDSALYFFQIVEQFEAGLGDTPDRGKTVNAIGNVHLAKGNYPEAMSEFNQAVLIAKKNNDYHTLSSAYCNIGNLFFTQKKFSPALVYYDSCFHLASENNFIDILITVYYQKSRAYEATKDFRRSLECFKLYQELQFSYSTEKGLLTETESLLLKQENENRILQLEKEQEKKKTLIVFLLLSVLILMISGIATIFIIRLYQKNRLRKVLSEVQRQQFQVAIESQESERKRIASDLHDSVGQLLSLTKLTLSDLSDHLTQSDKEIRERLDKSIIVLDEACNEVRTISHNLMPGTLIRLGLVAATKDLIRKLNQNKKFEISLDTENFDVRLDENIEVALYRILQEILNNAIKHSQSTKISISMEKLNQSASIKIIDDGIGFNVQDINLSRGIGWKNIYSRIASISGNIKVESNPGKGVKIYINIPV